MRAQQCSKLERVQALHTEWARQAGESGGLVTIGDFLVGLLVLLAMMILIYGRKGYPLWPHRHWIDALCQFHAARRKCAQNSSGSCRTVLTCREQS